jgi:FO synthase
MDRPYSRLMRGGSPSSLGDPPGSSSGDQALATAQGGERLTRSQALALTTFSGRRLDPMLATARAVRARRGSLVTFSPAVLLPWSEADALDVASAAAEAGCTEAQFRYRPAGPEHALEHIRQRAGRVLDETGLLPNLELGVVGPAEIAALRPVSAAMGLTLDSGSAAVGRLATIDEAGRQGVPFTSGIRIGIGEARAQRIESLLAIRDLHERHGHVQSVTVRRGRAQPALQEQLWTAAAARLVLGDEVAVQVPPDLSDQGFLRLLEAGLDDWGALWPGEPIDVLERATEEAGLRLAPRLPIHPRLLRAGRAWLEPRPHARALALSDASGLARRDRWRAGASEPPPRTFRSWIAGAGRPHPARRSRPTGPVRAALELARRGEEIGEDGLTALLEARGSDFLAVCEAADELRRETVGEAVSYVVNRNINYTNVCYFRCGFCAFSKGRPGDDLRGAPYVVPLEEIERRVAEAWDRGATEVCLQGGIHPSFTGDFYLDVVRAVKRAAPDIHVHAFTPLEIWQGAATLGIDLATYLERLRAAGLSSLPGTSAEILDDEVRSVICPDKNTTAQWVDVMLTAHRVGLRATTTMMFGHVETPRHWARHLIVLREAQLRGGGFTEFVPLPFVHMEAPIARRGLARHGPTLEEAVLVHAVARLGLHPLITNVQASWVKLGPDGARIALRAGANDLGGTLMNESISRAAGAAHGQELPPERMKDLIRSIGRRPRQRSTLYADVPAERQAAARCAAPLAEPRNPPAREWGLPSRERLIRPGLLAAGR